MHTYLIGASLPFAQTAEFVVTANSADEARQIIGRFAIDTWIIRNL